MAIEPAAHAEAPDARSAVRAHLERARLALRGRGALAPASVHEFRRELRRARAGLRLLRDSVGEADYAQANAGLRDAARLLGPLRDADIAVHTVERLRSRRGMRDHRAGLGRQRAVLQAEARELRAASRRRGTESLLEPVVRIAGRVADWRLPYDAAPVLRLGLARVYGRGRRAMQAARRKATDASLHEARKQARSLGSVLAILAASGSKRARRLASDASEITAALGDDHDLAVLRPRLWRADRALAARVARKRARLQKKALAMGRKLFRWKRRRFAEMLVPGGARRG